MPQLLQADGVCHQDQHASPNRLPLRTLQRAVVDIGAKCRIAKGRGAHPTTVMFALAIWMLWQAGFFQPIASAQLSAAPASGAATVGLMANAAMLTIAYFSAHLLNFGHFARFGKSEAAMKMGNLGIETYLPPPADAPGQ
jgi:hypothetical protein